MDDDAIPKHLSGAERDALCDDTERKDEGTANLEEQDANTTQPSNRRGAIPAPRGDDRYNIRWADQFVSQISIDQRSGGGPPVESMPRMKDVEDPTKLSRAD